MSGGFGAGFVKGAFISLIGVGAVSLVAPLDRVDPASKTQVDLSTPAGSGFNAERTDTNPVLPVTDQEAIPKEAQKPQQKPAIAVLAQPTPALDTTPATQPQTPSVSTLPKVSAGEDKVALTTPPADLTPISKPPALGLPMPAIDNPLTEVPRNNLPKITRPATEITPPAALSADNSQSSAPNTTTDTPPDAAPKPQITAQTETPVTVAPEGSPPPQPQQAGALTRNRIGFDNPNNKPLMSVILIDAGDDGLGTEVLRTFTFPVTFAIKSDAPKATFRAKLMAQSGFEILAVTPSGANELSASENPADTTTALSKIFATIPEAVGLIDPITADMQSVPKLVDQVIANLKKSGHGFLSYDIGLNTSDKKARHEGLPSAVVFRVLDAERESGVVIKRYLDRAVLEAQKTGQVIVLGRTYPETVTALFSWALSAKSATIALAPVSASLLAR